MDYEKLKHSFEEKNRVIKFFVRPLLCFFYQFVIIIMQIS